MTSCPCPSFVPYPAHYEMVPRWLRWLRCSVLGDPSNPEACEIDRRHFYVRAQLVVPVVDGPEPFAWGVWSSLSKQNYERMLGLWETEGRESEEPYFGWLSVALPLYPSTLNLKALVHTQPVGQRPLLELEPTSHPLATEQQNGITMARVQQIAESLLHG